MLREWTATVPSFLIEVFFAGLTGIHGLNTVPCVVWEGGKLLPNRERGSHGEETSLDAGRSYNSSCPGPVQRWAQSAYKALSRLG